MEGGILVGKREGNSTPSMAWKFGLFQPDGSLIQDSNFSTYSNNLSARKLGANLWEVQPLLNLNVAKLSKNRHFAEPVPLDQSLAEQVTPRGLEITSNASLQSIGKFGESNYSLRTPAELVEVLDRIWSLEEKHASDMSLVKMLKRERDQSRTRMKELLQEKKRDQKEIDKLTKEITERRHSENLHHKLDLEVSELKSLFSNALNELDQERKARVLLEELCNEFAMGIRDYEQEIRFMKHKYCKDHIGRESNDGLILHISEAWLDELMQMKASDTRDTAEKPSILDKLGFEIETFVKAKQTNSAEKSYYPSLKSPRESDILGHSLESFHLNAPKIAPSNGKDEDDSVGVVHVCCSQFHRSPRLKQENGLTNQELDIMSDSHLKESAKLKGSQKIVKCSDLSRFQMQLEEPAIENVSYKERNHHHHPVNEESTRASTRNVGETNDLKVMRRTRAMQRASSEGRNSYKMINAHFGMPKRTTRSSSTPEGKKYKMQDCLDPYMSSGSSTTVKKFTYEVTATDPEISESSSTWLPQSLKPNNLKAKLMEARLEAQQSRVRFPKACPDILNSRVVYP